MNLSGRVYGMLNMKYALIFTSDLTSCEVFILTYQFLQLLCNFLMTYKIILSTYKGSIISFQNQLSFFSIFLARTSSTTLTISDESKNPCFVFDFRKKVFNIFILRHDTSHRAFGDVLCKSEKIPVHYNQFDFVQHCI